VTSPTSASRRPDRDVEHDLISLLSTHGEREGAALAAYQRLADDSSDEGLQYLIRLILQDEQRHHRVIAEMLNQLQSFVWEVDVADSVPGAVRGSDAGLREETTRLLALEREDAKELRRLRKALQQEPSSSLLPLLASLMLHDTAKHIEILEFIRKAASAR
jgi:hypothetical protein